MSAAARGIRIYFELVTKRWRLGSVSRRHRALSLVMDNLENVFRMFEAHMQSYQGNDPLGEWESFMKWIEENFPENKEYLMVLLQQLMKEFLDKKRYHNDSRFINYCLKFAEYNSDLHQFFEFLYNQGIGTKSSPLYISWAGHLEAQGALQHASAVFRRGIQNQAEPRELLQEQYSLFQARLTGAHLPAQGFIMNMFQAPTLPDISDDKDEWPSLDQNEDAFEAQFQKNAVSSGAWGVDKIMSLSSAFPIFEDGNKENYGLPQPKNKPAGARTFGERSVSKFPSTANEAPHIDEFVDDSTVCGYRYNKTLAPSSKSTGDFTSAPQLSSTPFHKFPADSVQIPEDK
ncbi:hypothetical protein STEG23_006173, partial [Scotinomys teguina]